VNEGTEVDRVPLRIEPLATDIDALLVGYYDETGLRFAGKVRAGFVPHLHREVFKALEPHHVDGCPFVDLPNPEVIPLGRRRDG
jgi:ATP-dependent DNA ligase